MRHARALAACAMSLMLAACGTLGPTPTPTPTGLSEASCREAARGVGHAVQQMVDAYAAPTPADGSPSPDAASPATPPTPSDAATPTAGDAIQEAVRVAGRAVTDGGCPAELVREEVDRSVAAVQARGPVAEAVRARVVAGLDGQTGKPAATIELDAGADLRAAVASAPAGSTLRLAAGAYPLPTTLVLLDGITVRGAGPDATTLTSAAPEASVLVVTSARVELVDLALQRPDAPAGSGIVAGGGAALVLTRTGVAGARREGQQGGAGVVMADRQGEASDRGTTLQVTDATFTDNAWAGLAVTGSHRVSIERAVFEGNGDCGLCFLDSSSGSVRDGTFTDNAVGIGVSGSARPVIIGGTVRGGEIGVQVTDTAAPTIDGTAIAGASRAGLLVTGSATGAIARTACTDVPHGLVVGDDAAPTLTDNGCQLVRGA